VSTTDGLGLELLFLGTGNAFAAEGRAFSSFLLNGRHLFDCGPTVLQQLKRGGISSRQIEGVFISHFHADHFFGLPFLFLDAWREGRSEDLWIAGPPGIGQRSEELLELGFPKLPGGLNSFKRRYVEVSDGSHSELAGLPFVTSEVEHVPSLRCFAFQAHTAGASLTYSGDSRLCSGLMRLVPDADVLVLECACSEDPVHLCPDDINLIRNKARPDARIIITHLDDGSKEVLSPYTMASDLSLHRL
jgi:ribonuclease BN (tRNA processing enzyme)